MDFIAISSRYCVQNETAMFFVIAAWGVQCGHCDAVARILWKSKVNGPRPFRVKRKPQKDDEPQGSKALMWIQTNSPVMGAMTQKSFEIWNPIFGVCASWKARVGPANQKTCLLHVTKVLQWTIGWFTIEEDGLRRRLVAFTCTFEASCSVCFVSCVYVYSGSSKIMVVYCTKMTMEDKHYIRGIYMFPLWILITSRFTNVYQFIIQGGFVKFTCVCHVNVLVGMPSWFCIASKIALMNATGWQIGLSNQDAVKLGKHLGIMSICTYIRPLIELHAV